MELSLGLLCSYAEQESWPMAAAVTTGHIEAYLVYLQGRPRWFGDREKANPRRVSQSHFETQYRRLKRFFNWLVERAYIESNPLDQIPHPHIDEVTVPTVPEQAILTMLELTDYRHARTPSERFRAIRNRACLYLFLDTPGRRDEIARLQMGDVDLEAANITVMGKGRRQRRTPLGSTALDALWSDLQARPSRRIHTEDLWVDDGGRPMTPMWIYRMLRRLGERADLPGLHTHQFRHTYAVGMLRARMPERIIEMVGGWRRIPATYFRTLGDDDAAAMHQDVSPADRLAEKLRPFHRSLGKTRGSPPKGRL
jgi:site-specific recombinase XerD